LLIRNCPECKAESRSGVRGVYCCGAHDPAIYWNGSTGERCEGFPEPKIFDPIRHVSDAQVMYDYAPTASQQMEALGMEDLAREYPT
jgi:hypothetical protein